MGQPRRRQRLTRALGYTSLALGVPTLARPQALARVIGLRPTAGASALLRGVGAQELLAGMGILLRPAGAAGWLWTRVAGDALHLGLLGRAGDDRRNDGGKVTRATSLVAGALLVDVVAAVRAARDAGERGGLRATGTITVNRPPQEVFARWRDVARLPEFMAHLESVEPISDQRSRWVARGPGRKRYRWEALIVRELPDRLIEWRSVGRTTVPNQGLVRFEPAPEGGTEVSVDLCYEPPGGRAGAAVAALLGDEPRQQVRDDLRRFKQILETGEVVRSDSTPEGTLARRQSHLRQRPAQPMAIRRGERSRA